MKRLTSIKTKTRFFQKFHPILILDNSRIGFDSSSLNHLKINIDFDSSNHLKPKLDHNYL
jgi:hypothetical protein